MQVCLVEDAALPQAVAGQSVLQIRRPWLQ
jgi:hypothetical protein